MIALYSLTIFLGAALLFAVQPLFARLVLPLLGGAPAVWNASMVFFQATLLAGYGYAHLLSSRVRPSRQAWVHAGVLLVAVISLPIAIPAGWVPPTQSNPVWWLLAVAAVGVGLPFFAVSATSPLLQRWLSATDHPAARDPYFLYAASNLGSLIALLGYPVVVEPLWTLPEQSRWWAVGYGGLVVLVAGCAVVGSRAGRGAEATPSLPEEEKSIAWRRRVRWVLLAFVPSSLMLSVTNYISTDIAAIPLLWVIPLAIYLGTFSLAFARRQLLSTAAITHFFRLMVALMVITLAMRENSPLSLLILLHLVGLFAVGLMCHRELAADRPPVRHLTEFYLWLSFGGVLGGVFNALLAPVLFRSVLEYPAGLLLVALLVPRVKSTEDSPELRRRDLLWPLVLFLGSVLLMAGMNYLPAVGGTAAGQRLVIALAAVVAYSFARRPRRFALGLLVLLGIGSLQERGSGHLLRAERTFFGIHRVLSDGRGEYHRLLHGSTQHGAQSLDPARRDEPLLYYTRSGPLGQLMVARHDRVAVVGLGAGATACYAEPGDEWTYYEIDPAVERIARDQNFFTYLGDCRGKTRVVLGDARLTLRAAPNGAYRTLILDAYSSDAIPLHLITREALALYLQKVSADGVLAWHITNRHIDLEPVLAALARDAGLVCRVQYESTILRADADRGKSASCWAVMAREVRFLGAIADDPRWPPAQGRADVPVWTDHYANLISVLRWFKPSSGGR